MCHHTREPTVLSRVSCRPFHLNDDRFHQPGRTSRIGEDCRPRTTWRPLALLGSPALGGATSTGRYHGRTSSRPFTHPCMCHPTKDVYKHAGSGPSLVRRRLFGTCLGHPIHLALQGSGGYSETLFSAIDFDCSICDWEYEVSISLRR